MQHLTTIQKEYTHARTHQQVSIDELTLEIMRTEQEFDAIEGEWNNLVQDSTCSVFQTFEWVRTWWKYFHRRHELKIMLFRESGKLVGIAPMFIQRVRVLGIPLARRLQFIGCGLSDYADFIIAPGYEQKVLTIFVKRILNVAEKWDILDLEDVNETSPVFQYLPNLLREHDLPVYRYQGNVCPQIALPETAEMLMQNLGSTTGYNFRRKFKKLQSGFTATVELYRSENDNLEKAYEQFSFIHGNRWRSQGYPSAFDKPIHSAFHNEIISKFAKRDWLRMFFLKAGTQPVAVNFSFNYKQRIYMYQSNAYGTEQIMKCSPGFLIRAIAMMEGIAEGCRVFDFLRGDEDYKYKEWKAVDSKNWFIRTSSPITANKARFYLYLSLEFLKKAKERVAREYYEFKRFQIVKKPTIEMTANYCLTKIAHLARLGAYFISRHSPLESIIVGGNGSEVGFDPARSTERFHNAALQTYTLGEKVTRVIRSYKLNNLLWRIRARVYKPHVLDAVTSQHSGLIKIVERGPERQLILDNSTHSIFLRRENWNEIKREYWGAMCTSPFTLPEKPEVLLCGLGGGTILHLLHRSVRPASVTALEIDPVVIDIAKKHFGLETLPNVTVIEGNAVTTVRKLQLLNKKFDLILDDVFYSVTGTLSNYQRSFIKRLSSMLTPEGTIIFQRPVDRREDDVDADKFVKALRNMNFQVQTKKIRQRWWNNVIYCKPDASWHD
jgi:CelD/BcsL family acetyltransferase involved in cellulose biosynthesis/2-polyprenyl-3-methyl-5-hydroxy-6-metoxy-1,4-benzoquinol methylase